MASFGAAARFALVWLVSLGTAGCAAASGARPTEVSTVFIRDTGVAPPATAPRLPLPPLERPGHYRVAFTTGREHGCSLSYASTFVRGEYVLDLRTDGHASLTITATTTTTFGSRMIASGSGGGAPQTSTTTTTAASSWKGEARAARDRIDIVLHEAGIACAGSRRAACSGRPAIRLACAFTRVDVAPAPVADLEAGAAPVTVDVLRCSGAPSPFDDGDPAFAERLPLSPSEPLAMSRGRWRPEEALFLEPPSP